jgi:hypothetical protein
VHPDAPSRRSASLRSVALAHVVHPVTSSPGCTGSISTLSHAVSPLDFLSVGRTGSRRASGHCVSRRDYSSSGLHQLYCAYAVHPDAPARRSTSRQSVALALAVWPVIPLCVMTTRLVAGTDILRLRRASGCLGTSRGSSRGSSCRSSSTTPPRAVSSSTTPPCAGSSSTTPSRVVSSSTTPPRAGSSSTTSPSPHVRVPRHVARLVTRLVAPLVVDYSASRRLVIDYFAFAARLGASARRAARHAARRAAPRRLLRLAQACRRLLRLRRASGCLDTSRGSSRGSSRRS